MVNISVLHVPETHTKTYNFSEKLDVDWENFLMKPSTMNRQGRIQVKDVSRLPRKPILHKKKKMNKI